MIRGESHGFEHHDDRNFFVDGVVAEVDAVVLGEHIGLGFSFQSGGGDTGLRTFVGAAHFLFDKNSMEGTEDEGRVMKGFGVTITCSWTSAPEQGSPFRYL